MLADCLRFGHGLVAFAPKAGSDPASAVGSGFSAEIPTICHHLPPSGGLDEHVQVYGWSPKTANRQDSKGPQHGKDACRGARSANVATTAPTWADGATEAEDAATRAQSRTLAARSPKVSPPLAGTPRKA